MDVGKAIKEIREKKGLSQDALATKAGITQAALSHIERGRKRGNEGTLNKICEALGIPLSLLYIYGCEREDVAEEKRPLYDMLYPIIQDLIHRVVP